MLLLLHLNMLLSGGSPVAPTITTLTLPTGHVGYPYSSTLSATGGGPYTWEVSAGALPTWASLNASTGAITGTPDAAGTTSFTIRVTNEAGNDTREFALIVSELPAALGYGANVFIPLVFARHLKGLKRMNYPALLSAAATEAAGAAMWARYNHFGVLLVKPRLVPAF